MAVRVRLPDGTIRVLRSVTPPQGKKADEYLLGRVQEAMFRGQGEQATFWTEDGGVVSSAYITEAWPDATSWPGEVTARLK